MWCFQLEGMRGAGLAAAAWLLSALRAFAKSTRSSLHSGMCLGGAGLQNKRLFLGVLPAGRRNGQLTAPCLAPPSPWAFYMLLFPWLTARRMLSSSASCPGTKNCSRARGFLARLLQEAATFGSGHEGAVSQPAAAVRQLLGICSPVKSKRCRGAELCPQRRCRRGRKSPPVGRYLQRAELGSTGVSAHAALLAAPVLHLPACGIGAAHPEELVFEKQNKKM